MIAMLEFLTITFIIMLAAISPGPDFAIVVKNALMHDRKSGVFTAMGVSCSLLIHASYCILGLAIIITRSLWLFSIIKYLGAAYLIYIGLKSLFSKDPRFHFNEKINQTPMGALKSFTQGFLCNLLNPKAIMFILAFFTLIINPSLSWVKQTGYGIEIAFIHFLWFSWLAIMISHERVKVHLSNIQHYVIKAMGVALIGFGARIAFLSQS